jgi:hypothetical protein
MTDPGIYLVNATGESSALATESDSGDESLYTYAVEAHTHTHDYECPLCRTAIRATSTEYVNHDDDNLVLPYPHEQFTDFDHTSDRDQLWRCPNDDCRIERLTPGDSDE